MSLRINQNVTSLSTYSNLSATTKKQESSIAKLSSGLRINTAADDAAGLAISEKMRSQVRGLQRAKLNAQDGVSMLQTAEGGLNETESIIQRMRELAIQASNDTLTPNDRLEIQKEITQLRDAIDNIANSTEFNTKKLLNGSQGLQLSSSSAFITGLATGSGALGGDYKISMAVVTAGISQMQKTQIFRDKNTGELAKGNTKLEDIEQFYDENGVFALASQQTLTITGNAETTQFLVDGQMTLNELAAQFQNALAGASNLAIRNSQVEVINTATTGISGLGGYLQFTSGTIGDQGEFAIAGDQAMLDALGISITREAVNNNVQLRIEDSHGNVRTVNTSSDRAFGLLDGLDIQFDSVPAQVAGCGGVVDGLRFISSGEKLTFRFNPNPSGAGEVTVVVTFSAVNAAVQTQNAYSLDAIAKKINQAIANTLDINGDKIGANTGCQAAVVDGNIRISFNPTHDNAPTDIEILSGCTTLGLVEGNYVGFIDGEKEPARMIRGISRLNDDFANNGSVNFRIRLSVTDGANFGTSITVGTTVTIGQPDLLESKEFIINCNKTLYGTSNTTLTPESLVRMDIVGDSLAFTATNLGDVNRNTQGDFISQVKIHTIISGANTVNAAGDPTNADIFFNTMMSYKDGIKLGQGDTNYRIRVIDTTPVLQIGANAGQQMEVGISNMSTKALGIDRLDMSTSAGASEAIEKLDQALSKVSAERSKLGAYVNRLNYTMNNLDNTATNLTESESRIRDVDMAQEMISFTSSQIMSQAGTAMLAQANAMGQSVLSLLQ